MVRSVSSMDSKFLFSYGKVSFYYFLAKLLLSGPIIHFQLMLAGIFGKIIFKPGPVFFFLLQQVIRNFSWSYRYGLKGRRQSGRSKWKFSYLSGPITCTFMICSIEILNPFPLDNKLWLCMSNIIVWWVRYHLFMTGSLVLMVTWWSLIRHSVFIRA